jgi:predicted DNA-binding transcriptional regulator AlpA
MASRTLAKRERETLTQNEVAEMFGVNRLTITRWVEQGLFPPPLKIGKLIKVWSRKVIMDKLEGK